MNDIEIKTVRLVVNSDNDASTMPQAGSLLSIRQPRLPRHAYGEQASSLRQVTATEIPVPHNPSSRNIRKTSRRRDIFFARIIPRIHPKYLSLRYTNNTAHYVRPPIHHSYRRSRRPHREVRPTYARTAEAPEEDKDRLLQAGRCRASTLDDRGILGRIPK